MLSLQTSQAAAHERPVPSLRKKAFFTALDVSPRLRGDHHHLLDDHLNASGHAVIAAALLEVIQAHRGP